MNATLLDTRDATIYGLGTRRRAVDYWSYVGVTPDRDGVEWSPGRCKVFSTTGLPAFPVDAPGSHDYYSKYAEASVRGDGRGDGRRQLRKRRVFCVNLTRAWAGPGRAFGHAAPPPRRSWRLGGLAKQSATFFPTMPRSASQGRLASRAVRSISARDWSAILCVQINH